MDAEKTEKPDKYNLMIRIDPDLGQKLKLERVHTGRPATRIVEDLLREHFQPSLPSVAR